MKITITRALAEINLLDSRIHKAISDSVFMATCKKSSEFVNKVDKRPDFAKNAQSSYDSINALIKRRDALKSLIFKANVETMVTISGETMSLADAIERKKSIAYLETLLRQMKNQFSNVTTLFERNQKEVENNLTAQIANLFNGKDTKKTDNVSIVEAYTESIKKELEWEVINPLQIQDKIKELENKITSFVSDVDYVLSETNCSTYIEIDEPQTAVETA